MNKPLENRIKKKNLNSINVFILIKSQKNKKGQKKKKGLKKKSEVIATNKKGQKKSIGK